MYTLLMLRNRICIFLYPKKRGKEKHCSRFLFTWNFIAFIVPLLWNWLQQLSTGCFFFHAQLHKFYFHSLDKIWYSIFLLNSISDTNNFIIYEFSFNVNNKFTFLFCIFFFSHKNIRMVIFSRVILGCTMCFTFWQFIIRIPFYFYKSFFFSSLWKCFNN